MTSQRRIIVGVVLVLLVVAGAAIAYVLVQRGQAGTAVGTTPMAPTVAPQQAPALTLTLTKTAAPTTAQPGGTINYTLNWQASGTVTHAALAQIVDDYDQGNVAAVSSISNGGTSDGDKITWAIGAIDLTGGPVSGTFTYTATLNPSFPTLPASVNNTATFSTADPFASTTGSSTVTVQGAQIPTPQPTLAIVKNVVDIDGGQVERGDTLRYTITVSNTGQGTATGVAVTDNVGTFLQQFTVTATPAGSTNGSSPAPAGANQTGLLSVSGFNLTPSAQATIEYTVKIAGNAPDNTTIANLAVASDDQGDRVQDDANVVVSVPAPAVSITPTTTTTTPATPTTPEVVQAPVTGVDPLVAVWLAIAGAIVVSVVGYAAFVTFKVLR